MAYDDIIDDLGWEPALNVRESSPEVVAMFYDPLEAEMAAAHLRAEGIPCFLASRTAQSVMPHLQLLVRLHVRPQDVRRARRILTEAGIDIDTQEESGAGRWIMTALFALLGLLLAVLFVMVMAARE